MRLYLASHNFGPYTDELLKLVGEGRKALFIENPNDRSNSFDDRDKDDMKRLQPWCDVAKLPYTSMGPYLKEMFEKAFIDGTEIAGYEELEDGTRRWTYQVTATELGLIPALRRLMPWLYRKPAS